MTQCSGKFQAAIVLCQHLDPLAWTFDLQRRPRLSGKCLSLILSLIRTLHLILVRRGIMDDSIHLDPIHLHHTDRPDETFCFVLVHRFSSCLQRACFSERLLLPVLKNPLHACREQYNMLRFRWEWESFISVAVRFCTEAEVVTCKEIAREKREFESQEAQAGAKWAAKSTKRAKGPSYQGTSFCYQHRQGARDAACSGSFQTTHTLSGKK